VAAQRLLKGKAGSLSAVLLDTNGNPAAALGAVTVGVVSASGAVIVAPGTATVAGSGTGAGFYTLAVTAAQCAKLDIWTATWTDAGNGSTQQTDHEICGGFFFSLAEARASDPVLFDSSKYPDAAVMEKRQGVEEECEFICDAAFVPRYGRVVLDGTASPDLFLPDARIRAIRSAQVTVAPGNVVVFTAPQLAAVVIDEDFHLQRNDGGIWDEGRRNVVVEYEYGWDGPPTDLKDAAMLRLRNVLNRSRSTVPDRATTFVTEGGVTYRLDAPEAFKTGIPEVDAVYGRYSTRRFGDADPIPASHQMQFSPSWWSVYHGGRR